MTLRAKKVYIFVRKYVWFGAYLISDVFHMNFLIRSIGFVHKFSVNFYRYLHIQDGVLRSWCYFMKWLVSHGLSACQICKWQVTWLMRYRKTLFAHGRWRSCKLVLFYEMMGYSWRKCLQNLKAITYVANVIQTKEYAFVWTLTIIYISKMASYEVGVILWNDWLVMA